jgi:hypothetical protein
MKCIKVVARPKTNLVKQNASNSSIVKTSQIGYLANDKEKDTETLKALLMMIQRSSRY